MPIIALTGTPGTGKTRVLAELKKLGFCATSIRELVRANPHLVAGYDRRRQVPEVDVAALDRLVRKKLAGPGIWVVEGHYSHLLRAKTAIVLRCRPKVLIGRLQARRWRKAKISENAEAEALGVITAESLRIHGNNNVFEIDTTAKSARATAKAARAILAGNRRAIAAGRAGKIDYTGDILSWY